MNIGEEICGEWLRHIKGCEFVQYNLKTTDVQGEIDVIGINLSERTVYVCEVAIHLVTGLQYNDNVPKLLAKFNKDIDYAQKAFPDYRHVFMFWSPVVRDQRAGSKNNQLRDVMDVVAKLEQKRGITLQPIINERFQEALTAMRAFAGTQTKELDSSVMRYLQVEEHLAKHLEKAHAKKPAANVAEIGGTLSYAGEV